ncbi:hypothetical protein FT643_14680 [Ketobacter sp. MCCC 1A13808]|uniref:hypothetical protein n=1 Tax=Ketobacter sp. MCCC 1A13808 TaxID=2602738 RepID=UPI0012EBF251|nr:hypothetical protein [Ketobacter sp. MCCC 1A13808]MVF13384.1 hypothetical protein [Ketobacter sp. MCCC 1A13808]
MRSLIVALAFVAFVSACSHSIAPTVLKFHDSSGCEFDITSFRADYEKCYEKVIDSNVLVLLSTSKGERRLNRQISEFNSTDYENLNLIIVRGYDYKLDKSGYYLDKDESGLLLSDHEYSALLYNQKGILKAHNTGVLTYDDIAALLKN